MKSLYVRCARCFTSVICVVLLVDVAAAATQTLRVVTYNIDADFNAPIGQMGSPQAGPGLTTVLQAIGNEHLAGNAQPIDVLALQELNSTPSTTLSYIIAQLNGIYGAGTYAYDTTADPTTSTGGGGGPSGLIYNTTTVQLLGAAAIGSVSGSGAARAPMRYKLAPKGYNDHSADFFLYVSHMKANSFSGDQTTNMARRNVEANTIRTNSATATVGAIAHVIYAGDMNLNGSFEAAYQTLLSTSVASGIGHAVDVLAQTPRAPNPANYWDDSATYQDLLTEQIPNPDPNSNQEPIVYYRDDFQLVTDPMTIHAGVDPYPGMKLLSNTLTSFGNGGSIYQQSVTDPANNGALSDLPNQSAALLALTTATDHLPVVADYSFASAVGIPGDYDHSGLVNIADYTLWQTAFGSTTSLAADGNHDGTVNAADYVVWRDHLGSFVAGAGAGAFGAPVPEPSAAVLLLVGGCLAGLSVGRLRG